jgi:1-phosphofructokinase
MMKILCCGFFPALQRTLSLSKLEVGAVNRARSVTRTVGGKASNSARVLEMLGAEPVLLGFSGGFTGMAVCDLLDKENSNIP